MQRGNGTSACASCKHQRKKCAETCTLAPFFPVEKGREFEAVQKVFGVSNVTKIIARLKEEDRKVAVDSLVWEALCRQRDPVLGPYRDYTRVCEELRLCRSQGLMGWPANNIVMNNNNNFHGNGNSVMDFPTSGYSHILHQDTQTLRENGSAMILPHQNLANGFNQQFFIAGQYIPPDSKSMESTMWEGSS